MTACLDCLAALDRIVNRWYPQAARREQPAEHKEEYWSYSRHSWLLLGYPAS